MRYLLAIVALAGCKAPDAAREQTALAYSADWDGVVAFVDDACVACHVAGGSAEFVPLPLALQVDLQDETDRWVVPFDPQASMLWRLVSGDLAQGDVGVMPLGSDPLPTHQIDHVRLWILDGAPAPPIPVDADGDGFLSDVDCDDANPDVNPGVVEVCDGIDNDCVDGVDDGGAVDASIWYLDDDGDGYGLDTETMAACDQPAGYAEWAGDCDDTDPARYPSAPETDCLDPTDWNCDGFAGTTDADGDGLAACEECNDADPAVFPGADELCNGADDDCDGEVDEDPVDGDQWWRDDDGDGYGNGAGITLAHCTGTTGWVTNGDDCDDTDDLVNPAAPLDLGNGIDDDCDGTVDEDAAAVISHAVSIQPIWDANCLFPCHSGFVPSDGLNLSVDAWGDFVNVPSNDVSAMDRVEPGDPQNSYLWHKLNGTQTSVGGTGSQMPKNGQSLSATELALIEQWILDGANP